VHHVGHSPRIRGSMTITYVRLQSQLNLLILGDKKL